MQALGNAGLRGVAVKLRACVTPLQAADALAPYTSMHITQSRSSVKSAPDIMRIPVQLARQSGGLVSMGTQTLTTGEMAAQIHNVDLPLLWDPSMALDDSCFCEVAQY